jgi:hypothetical protein
MAFSSEMLSVLRYLDVFLINIV